MLRNSICMCLHCMEVCMHLCMVWAGSCRKCELHNWGNVPRDNLYVIKKKKKKRSSLKVWVEIFHI